MAVSRSVIKKVLAIETEEVRSSYSTHLRLLTILAGRRRTRSAIHRNDEPTQLDSFPDVRPLPCL